MRQAPWKSKIITVPFFVAILTSASFAMEQKDLIKYIIKGKSPDYETAVDFIGTNTPPLLPQALKNEYFDYRDTRVKERILSALMLYPSEQIAPVWIDILKSTEQSSLEIAIIDHLGNSGMFTAAIAEKLITPLSDVRARAAAVLKKSGDDRVLPVILKLAESGNPIDRIYLLEALNHLYDRRFQKLVLSFLNDTNKSVRIYALKCAMDNDIKEAVPAMKRIVTSDENDEVRKRAIIALAGLKDTGSGQIISSVLKEGKKDLSLEAIRALKELKYFNAAPPLSEMLLRETDNEIKGAVMDALAAFGRAGNINGLRHILTEDKDPLMRIRAVYTLGETGEERSTIDIITLSLSDPDYRVRGEGCNALGKLKKSRPSQLLINQIRTDSSRYTRSAALYSLEIIKDKKDIIPLFDIYSMEKDTVFRELLRNYLRGYLVNLVR